MEPIAETIHEVPREHSLGFPETTGQGESTQGSHQPTHHKKPQISSAQISDNKQMAANCTNTFKQGENSMTAADTPIDNDDEQDQLQSKMKTAAVDLGGDRKRTRLLKTPETKVEADDQHLPNHAKKSAIVQASSAIGSHTGILIPDSRTKKYWPFEALRHPLLPAPALNSCKERVIERLKEAVDDHNVLQHRAQFIDYKAGMVGRAPDQSWASILLFCQERDQKKLKKLLEPGFLTRMNCCSPYRPKLLSWASVPNDPLFWIYIFPFITNPTNRFAASEPVVISFHAASMSGFCGALAEHQGRVATVGLTVEVDGIARLLTVDHIFNEEICEDRSPDIDSDDEISWYYESSDEDDDSLSEGSGSFFDPLWALSENDPGTPTFLRRDEEKKASRDSDTSSEGPTLNGTQTHISDAGYHNAGQEQDTASRRIEDPIESKTSAHKVQWPNDLPHEHPYLDWACLELDGKIRDHRLESYISIADKTRVVLEEIEDKPTSHTTPVFMISGLRGVRLGNLLAERLHLGSLPGQQMCRVWTLVLDSQKALVPGECGSVVVDQDTHKVYGHVIGSNALGHAYVVSSREVLDQMKLAFSTDVVYLPCRYSLPASPQLLGSDVDSHAVIQAPLSQSLAGRKTSSETFKSNLRQNFGLSSPTTSSEQLVAQPENTGSLFDQHLELAEQFQQFPFVQQEQPMAPPQRPTFPSRSRFLPAVTTRHVVSTFSTREPVEASTWGPSSSYSDSAGDVEVFHTDAEDEDLTSTEFSLVMPPKIFEGPGPSAVKRSRSPADDESDQEKKRTKRSRSHHSSNSAV